MTTRETACTMSKSKSIAQEFCPVTCGAPCAARPTAVRNATCQIHLGNETGIAPSPSPGSVEQAKSDLPFCYQTSVSSTGTTAKELAHLIDISHYTEEVISTELLSGEVSDPTDTSSCVCSDWPDFSKANSFDMDCASLRAFHLQANAPNCVVDETGTIPDSVMNLVRIMCPMSCGVCKGNDDSGPKQRREGQQPRGQYFPKCALPENVIPSNQSGVATVSALAGGKECTLCSNVTIQAGASLNVRGTQIAPAIISGGGATRHFLVFGALTLEDVVLYNLTAVWPRYNVSVSPYGSLALPVPGSTFCNLEVVRPSRALSLLGGGRGGIAGR